MTDDLNPATYSGEVASLQVTITAPYRRDDWTSRDTQVEGSIGSIVISLFLETGGLLRGTKTKVRERVKTFAVYMMVV